MSQIAVAAETGPVVGRGKHQRVLQPQGFFCPYNTQHVRSFPILYDLLTLAATLLAILLWGLCLSFWAP